MNVQPFVLRDLHDGAASSPSGRCVIRRYRPEQDRDDVVAIAAALAAPAAGPEPRVAGLLAELEGRPDRTITAWLASQHPAEHGVATGPATGLVTLVEARGRGGTRWSIGWLLVRPEARRQGIGRSLVGAAVHHARAAGATEIWTETSAAWPAAAFWRALGFEPAITRA